MAGLLLAAVFAALLGVCNTAGHIKRSAQDDLDHLRAVIPGEPGKDYPIYSTDILQKLARGRSSKRRTNKENSGRQKQTDEPRNGRTGEFKARRNNFQADIAKGKIPGDPGRDYPVHSITSLRKKFTNIQLAPPELVTPDFPFRLQRNGGKGAGAGGRKRPNVAPKPLSASTTTAFINPQRHRPKQHAQEGKRQPAKKQQQQQPRRRIPKPQTVRTTVQTAVAAAAPPPPPPTTRPLPKPEISRTITTSLRVASDDRRTPTVIGQVVASSTPPTVPRLPGEEVQPFNGRYCPGGSMGNCIDFCPREQSAFTKCVTDCGKAC